MVTTSGSRQLEPSKTQLRLCLVCGPLLVVAACGGRASDGSGYLVGAQDTSASRTPGTLPGSWSTGGMGAGGAAAATGGVAPSFGGTRSATGGIGASFGGATLVSVGGTNCAVVYGGQTYVTVVSEQLCGNGVLEASNGELCDDGNRTSGDGCSSMCRVESDWICDCGPCRTIVICGDGKLGPGELCDDGNTASGDGCSATCDTIEPDWICTSPGRPCVHVPGCGDGILEPGEQCDEGAGNTADHCGSCTNLCTFGVYCGDGIVQPDCGERCDLPGANTGSYGGCAADCTLAPYCGDGVVQPAYEECDLGQWNGDYRYGCTAVCKLYLIYP